MPKIKPSKSNTANAGNIKQFLGKTESNKKISEIKNNISKGIEQKIEEYTTKTGIRNEKIKEDFAYKQLNSGQKKYFNAELKRIEGLESGKQGEELKKFFN